MIVFIVYCIISILGTILLMVKHSEDMNLLDFIVSLLFLPIITIGVLAKTIYLIMKKELRR